MMKNSDLEPKSDDHINQEQILPVVLMEYADFECPYCRDAYGTLKSVLGELRGKFTFIFRHFPLSQVHPNAEFAAEASEAAAAQGNFWKFHDLLFENQEELGPGLYLSIADALGLDVDTFRTSLARREFQASVREDLMSGMRSGVNGTPSLFINSHRFNDVPTEQNLVRALRSHTEQANPSLNHGYLR